MDNKKIGKLVLSLALPAVIGAGMATIKVEAADTNGKTEQNSQVLEVSRGQKKQTTKKQVAKKQTTFTVTFDANGGTNAPAAIKTDAKGHFTFPKKVPTKSGDTFIGWSEWKSGPEKPIRLRRVGAPGKRFAEIRSGTIEEWPVQKNMTFYAIWKSMLKGNEFIYDANGGNWPDGKKVFKTRELRKNSDPYDRGVIPAMYYPEHDGLIFWEWRGNKTQNIHTVLGTMSAAVVEQFGKNIAYATWRIPAEKVVFGANGGENAPKPIKLIYKHQFTIPKQKPTREGYNFKGWALRGCYRFKDIKDKCFYPGKSYIASYPYMQGLYLEAIWKKNGSRAIYSVNFDANGGAGGPTYLETDSAGEFILPEEKPTRLGYTFIGWNTSRDGSEYSGKSGQKMFTNGDITVYAQWSKNAVHTVSFDANGGENAPAAITTDERGTFVLPNAPIREGYTFVGWNTESDGTGYSGNAGSRVYINKNCKLYAQWKK